MRVFSTLIIIAVLGTFLVFLFGVRTGPEVNTKIVSNIDYSPEYIFEFLEDIEKFPERKNGLLNIEVIERRGNTIVEWQENYENGDWQKIRINEKISPRVFSFDIFESRTGYTATIRHELSSNGTFTEITTTEVGEIPNTFYRGLRFVFRDTLAVEKEIKWLRVAIHKDLINKP